MRDFSTFFCSEFERFFLELRPANERSAIQWSSSMFLKVFGTGILVLVASFRSYIQANPYLIDELLHVGCVLDELDAKDAVVMIGVVLAEVDRLDVVVVDDATRKPPLDDLVDVDAHAKREGRQV